MKGGPLYQVQEATTCIFLPDEKSLVFDAISLTCRTQVKKIISASDCLCGFSIWLSMSIWLSIYTACIYDSWFIGNMIEVSDQN